MPYAAHGYAAFYTFSLLDRHYRPDFTTEEGLDLLKKCLKELETRMPIDFKGVFVCVFYSLIKGKDLLTRIFRLKLLAKMV